MDYEGNGASIVSLPYLETLLLFAILLNLKQTTYIKMGENPRLNIY